MIREKKSTLITRIQAKKINILLIFYKLLILISMEDKKIANERKLTKKEVLISLGIGSLAGLCNGLFGGGGGMVVVPMLTGVMQKDAKRAHATAILIILPLCVVSAVLYAIFGSYKWDLGLPVGIGVVIGGIIGALALKKISNFYISVIFSVVMVIAGVKMLF